MAKKKQAHRKVRFQPGLGWIKPLLAVLSVAGSALGLMLLLDWMNDPTAWPVRQVQIHGEFRQLRSSDMQAVVAPMAASGFFVMNVNAIQTAVQRLPWVDQVSVRRVWPDRLDIRVREQQPVARWGERALMNARADVFEPESLPALPQLARLDGPQGHQQRVLEMYRELALMLKPLQLGVTRLHLDARRTWGLTLSNGLELQVGRGNTVARVARFVRVYPAILAAGNGRLSTVDLRYSNGFAVHWQAPAQNVNTAGGPA